jgi:tryptophanyl-tRNA synthetase
MSRCRMLSCYFMVADWHALTTLTETKELKGHVRRVMAENIACGLDPDKVAFYCQSHVPETAELYLFLNMLAYVGELEKTPTFKDKVRLQPQNVNAGLADLSGPAGGGYPVAPGDAGAGRKGPGAAPGNGAELFQPVQ